MEYIPRGWIADAHCILDQRPNVTFESRPSRPVILPNHLSRGGSLRARRPSSLIWPIHLSRGGCLISRPGTKKGQPKPDPCRQYRLTPKLTPITRTAGGGWQRGGGCEKSSAD